MSNKKNKKILLHCCCAPCAAYVSELLGLTYDVSLFFYNPNIHPESEYQLRLKEIEHFAHFKEMNLIIGDYNVSEWLQDIKGYENEPECGKRCNICYYERFKKTAKVARRKKFDVWGTTLSISPHKDAEAINKIGRELKNKYKIDFLEADFKKNDGFKRSLELSNQYNFYRQNYCGCLFSQLPQINKSPHK
ncbi:epoxyqueuosine reductase QueH [Patescibacteria group bacterium]